MGKYQVFYMKKNKNKPKLFHTILKYSFAPIACLILLTLVARRAYMNYRIENYGRPCKAVIIGEENIHSWHQNRPGFVYIYFYNDLEITDKHSVYSFRDSTVIGDTIDIIVDPEHPNWSCPIN